MRLCTENLPKGYSLFSEMDNLGFERETFHIIISKTDLIFQIKTPATLQALGIPDDEPGLYVFQSEFPRSAVDWIVETMEDELWRCSNKGELSGYANVVENIAGENLSIRRSNTLGAHMGKGFTLVNFSRPSKNSEAGDSQGIDISDSLLMKGGLLNQLKILASPVFSKIMQ